MLKTRFNREEGSSIPDNEAWVGKYVHYEEDGQKLIGKIEDYTGDEDRYRIRPLNQEHGQRTFFLKGEKLRKLKIQEK